MKHLCNDLLPGSGILSAGRIIEVNLKSMKCTTVNKSSTGDDESVSHLKMRAQPRKSAQEIERVDSKYPRNISPLSVVLRNLPPTRLTSCSTFFFCCGAVHMDVKTDNNAESAKAYSDCRKTPTRSDVILIALVPNELKDVKIFALRDFVTEAHV